jgi:hypothetical protein
MVYVHPNNPTGELILPDLDAGGTHVVIDESFCDTTFYQSLNSISDVDLVFVIRPELVEFQHSVRAAMARFRESGALQKSIQTHSGTHTFPKGKC